MEISLSPFESFGEPFGICKLCFDLDSADIFFSSSLFSNCVLILARLVIKL